MNALTRLAALIITTGACGAAAQPVGQPGAPAPGQPGGPVRQREPQNPEAFKAGLQKWLAENKRVQERLETAIKKLEEGADPAEVAREFDFPGARWGRGEEGRGRRMEGQGPRDGRGRPDMGDRRPDDPWTGFQPGRPMTAEMRKGLTDFLQEHLPELATRLSVLREADPEAADKMLDRLAPRVREAARIRASDPKLFELRLKEVQAGIGVLEAVKDLRASQDLPESAADRPKRLDAATSALRARLTEQHEARMNLLAYEVESLAKRLEVMRSDLERKRSDGSTAVDEMARKIIEMREPGEGEGDGDRPRPRK